ncbi:MAG: hypothetical protein IT431_00500 [Phycisphaerales bacterium]|nr:hypothetical protein [Phycisphaerales bacterium]
MGNWIQILIVVLAIGGPAIGKALEAIHKQRQERERKKELEDSRREALRTGQPTAQIKVSTQAPPQMVAKEGSQPAATAQERIRELARKRQQQIEELRRRQQAAGQQGQQRQGPRPTTPPARSQPRATPAAGGRNQAPARPQSQTQPLPPARTPPRPPVQPQPRPQVRQQTIGMPPPVRPIPRRPQIVPQTEESDTTATSIHTLKAGPQMTRPSLEPAPAPVTIIGKAMTAEDWRRFIVAKELLDPPLALRRHSNEPME